MRNTLKKYIDIIFDKSQILSLICISLITIMDFSKFTDFSPDWFGVDGLKVGKFVYYFIIILSLLLGIISVKNGQEVNSLQIINDEKSNKINDLETILNEVVEETNELFNSYLRLFVKNLNFTHNERISVYKVYENKFKLIGRVAVDPTLSCVGRSEYPISDGFIGKGWREGEFFINNLPDSSSSNYKTYLKAVIDVNFISKEVVNSLKMKSRNYFVYRINGFDGVPKAVIVFESLNPSCFEKDFLVNKLDEVKQPLVMFIEKNNGIVLTENILGV